MLIHEVCERCRLTKKAIEYYIGQGLIRPALSENGYRDFSESEIEQLKKIAVLRGLGLAVPDIQAVLANPDGGALRKASQKKGLEISGLQEKQVLMEALAQDNDWEKACMRLEALEKKQSILQRLLGKFPGYYGKYLSYYFARFLGEPVATAAQQKAFETVIRYLDEVDIRVPEDLREYLDEASQYIDSATAAETFQGLSEAIQNTNQYMADNKEMLDEYIKILHSEEYRQIKQLPAYRLQALFRQLNQENGYYERFIPAMKALSPAYRQYHDDLLKANAIFIKEYGDRLDK